MTHQTTPFLRAKALQHQPWRQPVTSAATTKTDPAVYIAAIGLVLLVTSMIIGHNRQQVRAQQYVDREKWTLDDYQSRQMFPKERMPANPGHLPTYARNTMTHPTADLTCPALSITMSGNRTLGQTTITPTTADRECTACFHPFATWPT